MADETTSTWADLLREARGPLVEAIRWKTVLLAEIRRDKSPRRWHGKQVTIPIFLNPQQGAGMISETGSTAAINAPQIVDTEQAVLNTATAAVAVSFHPQVIKQAAGDENSWAEVIPTKMERAEEAFKRILNEQMCGFGNALLAQVLAAGGSETSPGLTLRVSSPDSTSLKPAFYQLYPGRVVDVLVRSSGADPGSGLKRKIASYVETGGTGTGALTFSTTGYGGGSGNITFSANEGVYIEGSYGQALQGILQAAATTGTFEGINKANVDAWKGTDVSPSSAADPTISVFDKAERKVAERSGRMVDFFLASPGVVDKYTQGLTVQARWAGEELTLQSGWTGVRYRNKAIVPEFDLARNNALGLSKEDMAIYTLDDGPDWDDMTGSIFQRSQSTRTLPVEAWLTWMLQFGFHNCNGLVRVSNLNEAD